MFYFTFHNLHLLDVWNIECHLIFFPFQNIKFKKSNINLITKFIFVGYTGSKNQVWTRKKIKFDLKSIFFRVCNKLPNWHFKNQAQIDTAREWWYQTALTSEYFHCLILKRIHAICHTSSLSQDNFINYRLFEYFSPTCTILNRTPPHFKLEPGAISATVSQILSHTLSPPHRNGF